MLAEEATNDVSILSNRGIRSDKAEINAKNRAEMSQSSLIEAFVLTPAKDEP